jgi:hypothetical protein
MEGGSYPRRDGGGHVQRDMVNDRDRDPALQVAPGD